MNRSALQVAVVALLAATAMVAVAGTVDDVNTGSGGGAAAPESAPAATTAADRTTTVATDTAVDRSHPRRGKSCLPWVTEPPAILAIVTGVLVFVGLVHRRGGRLPAVAAFMLVTVLLSLVYPVLAFCEPLEERDPPPNESVDRLENITGSGNDSTGNGTGESGDARRPPQVPVVVVAIVAVLAAAGIGGVLVTREGDDADDPFASEADVEDDPLEGVDVGEFAAAAGRAADRIEDAADVDNEIYRAWVEMTDYIDVEHPESSTPGEFAAAAVEAGVDRDDVVELTDLFERVRYGREDATRAREERALAALRRIESQYGGDGE